jgi:hypothetical protein
MLTGRNNTRGIALILLIVGIIFILCGGLTGGYLIWSTNRFVDTLPPPPEGPPDAGVYSYLLAYLVLLICIPSGLLQLLIAGIMVFVQRRREARAGLS